MSRFARLAIATVAATLVLIGIGGLVRATDSGLGCPDWPRCFGLYVPPAQAAPWIEHTHRLSALVVIGLIVALAVAARRTGQPRNVRLVTGWLVPLVLSQAVLGAVVVWFRLQAVSVAAHLSVALVIVGFATWVAVDSVRREQLSPATALAAPEPSARGAGRPVARLATLTAAVTFVQMVVGSLVTGLNAGLAYADFPAFNGGVLPAFDRAVWPGQVLHVAHRLLAYTLAVLVVALAIRARRSPGTDPLCRRLAVLAVGSVVLQIALGVLNLYWRLSPWSVTPHLLNGALLWTVLVVIALRSRAVATPFVPGLRSSSPAPPRARATA